MADYKPGELYEYLTERGRIVKVLGIFSYHTDKKRTYYRVRYLNEPHRAFIIPKDKAERLFKKVTLSIVDE